MIDLVLTGHDHDLFINYDERIAAVESSYDAHYVTAIDVTISIKEEDGKRITTWWPKFRVIDTAIVTPDPEVAAAVAEFEKEFTREMDVPLGTTAVELDSRGATVRTREAAIGNLIADAMRASTKADVAIMNGGGIRGGKLYPPGTEITRRDVLAELPFDNRVVTVEIKRRGAKGRDRERAFATAEASRRLSAGIGHDHRGRCEPPARQPRRLDPCRQCAAGRQADVHRRHQRFPVPAAATATTCSPTLRDSCPIPTRRCWRTR